jgi:hypothetical protein
MNTVFQFIKQNIACDILVALGLLAIYITYIGAPRASKKSDHYVSGIPTVGGFLIALGFLTSSCKWLAIIGLFEPAILYIIFKGIPDLIKWQISLKNWVPPEELEGGRVITYSSQKNRYEEIHIPNPECPRNSIVYPIERYIIIAVDSGHNLIGMELNGNYHLLLEAETVEECKKRASKKAKWKNR